MDLRVSLQEMMKCAQRCNTYCKGISRQNIFIVVASVMLLVAIVGASWFYRSTVSNSVPPSPSTNAVSENILRHPLTGKPIDTPLSVLPHVFGVMVENSYEAWPISGVDQAFLVIEAPVEASIPRFIAFFSEDQDVAKIGPVRSARAYYLDWNAEFDGIYGHVGGSPQALSTIIDRGVMDLNQFFQGEYYYRDERTRFAPHNVYTTTDDLRQSIAEMDDKYHMAAPSYDAWTFVDGPSSTSQPSTSLHISWSSSTMYDVDWTYRPSTNSYVRKQGGVTYDVNNLAILETTIGDIAGDDKGRKELKTLGTGSARLFHNGEEIAGTWKKPSAQERLRFYDADGKEIAMNAGKTWIEVVSSLDQLSKKESIE